MLVSTICIGKIQEHAVAVYNTNIFESLRSQITDIMDFLMDSHTSCKIKVIKIYVLLQYSLC